MTTLATSTLEVNGDRLMTRIEQLAQIGKLSQGGVRRLAYSQEDQQARCQVQQWMAEAGLSVRLDAAGNIIGRYPGKFPTLPALATGSHIDTVPAGGRYDGAYGVLAGIEVVQVLSDRHLQLDRPLEVIVFTDEEGTMIGAKAMSGKAIRDPNSYRHPDGTPIQNCLERIGGNWEQIQSAQRSVAEVVAFVELHVEQGPVLEAAGKSIGIVEGIVGQRRKSISLQGSPNHAGTTPMQMRRDALVAASQVVLAIHELGNLPGQQVATVGQMNVWPNAVNVIPGRVEMSVDVRDLSNENLDRLFAQLEQRIEAIALNTQTEIQISTYLHNDPVLATLQIQTAIAQVCDELGCSYLHLPSRASHDAQEIARFTDMGMIFVPSEAGLSHAEAEYTSPESCILGANVLLQTLLKLDRQYAER